MSRLKAAKSHVGNQDLARELTLVIYQWYMTSKRAIAKVFKTGRSQAVRIPKEYRFACDEVFIERDGERVILTPRPRSWRDYFATARRFTDDYPERIEDVAQKERDEF